MQVLALAFPLTKEKSTRTMIITTHKQFPNYKRYEIEYEGRQIGRASCRERV